MDWDADADAAVRKGPFFVRKRVRARVEKDAAAADRTTVTLADVTAARALFLAGMSSEIRGYQLDTCFGPGGCPSRAVAGDRLLERLEEVLKAADLLGVLKARVKGELKFHREFRVTLADCPNACSGSSAAAGFDTPRTIPILSVTERNSGRSAAMERKTFSVPTISCGHCVMTITKELTQLDGVRRVDGNPQAKTIDVQWESPATESAIRAVLGDINFPAA
jgi:copper chaperone CopZ